MDWMPPYTISGDLVCISYNACTPFLLRNETLNEGKHTYRLMEECFFHDIIDGKMLTSDHKIEDFVVY